MNKSDYKKYMERALELAALGWGNTSPNPMVGALLIEDGEVISEGYHKGPGADHAEAAVIKKAGNNAEGAALVVNLEPCCHTGRTPPCTDLIIKNKIKKVVFGMIDPNPIVNGNGIQQLKDAGIEVQGPMMEKESGSLNRIYVHWIKTGRPYIISKVAMSLDGKIATESGDSKWITGEKCRERMHYWRRGVDAVLVGAGTLRADDPSLDARGVGEARQPIPVVITSSGNISPDSKICKRDPKPIVICNNGGMSEEFKNKGVDIISVGGSGRIDWDVILSELGKRGITSILVEGGSDVHGQLIQNKLAGYMVASLSTKLIGSVGKDWLGGLNTESINETPNINPDQILVIDDDVVIEGEVCY